MLIVFGYKVGISVMHEKQPEQVFLSLQGNLWVGRLIHCCWLNQLTPLEIPIVHDQAVFQFHCGCIAIFGCTV